MINKHRNAGLLVLSFSLVLAWILCPAPLLAQDVVVSQASPSNAPQGTVNLNVRVTGNGFKKGAVAKWFVTGTTNPGGVTVNSTTFVSTTELTANISVASDAQTQLKFDVQVTLSSGRTGKGIELFKVIYNPPDPAIAFTDAGLTTLWVMNADGTNQTTILQPPNPKGSQHAAAVYRPNWSPDGSQLVFESTIQGVGIYVINKDGSGLRKVIGLNNGAGAADPVWSPAPAADGKWKIVFADEPAGMLQEDLFLVNPDGTGLMNLTNTPNSSEYWPTWDPYATRLAAQVYPPCLPNSNCAPHLYEYSLGLVNGVVGITGTTDLTAAGPLQGVSVYESDWANTQDEIVLNAGGNLWVVSLSDPANPQNITGTLGVSGVWPTWSPDDSKIAYRRMVNKKVTISVINADGSAVVDLANGDQPDWRRCGPTGAIACAP